MGIQDGAIDGQLVGIEDGMLDGTSLGTVDGRKDGAVVGKLVGVRDGRLEGILEGVLVGSESLAYTFESSVKVKYKSEVKWSEVIGDLGFEGKGKARLTQDKQCRD